MRTLVCSLALALPILAGCGNSAPPVDWGGKYSASVQVRLDRLVAAKDCAALRAELATAKSIDEAKQRSSGSGSEDLVAYIEWGMDEAGCESEEAE